MSLFTLWVDGQAAGNLGWLINYFQQLRPAVIPVCAPPNPDTGVWDFKVADAIAAACPFAEIEYRPYRTDENYLWQSKGEVRFIIDAQAQLQGRPYRVTYGNEPAFKGQLLTDHLAALVKFARECEHRQFKASLGGWQSRVYEALNQNPDRIDGGKWNDLLRVAGDLRDIVWMVYTEYTEYFIPAGVGKPSYLGQLKGQPQNADNVIDDETLLRDPKTWTTPIDTYNNPYQNRELLRYRWWNLHAATLTGCKEHTVFIREGWLDFDDDLANYERAKNLNGGVAPSGNNALTKLTEWKFQMPLQKALALQTKYLMDCYRLDPNAKAAAQYLWSTSEGDKRNYAVNEYTGFLEDMADAENSVEPTQPHTPPVPPVVIPPTVIALVKSRADTLNVRAEADLSALVVATVKRTDELKMIAPENATAMIGKFDMWVKVITPGGVTGWCAAWFIELSQPPTAPTRYTEGELQEILAALTNNPTGLTARLAQDAGLSKLMT